MILGLLYCRSNRRERAEKYYELVEIELTESLTFNDKEFVAYMPIMCSVVHDLMFRLYRSHRDQTPEANQPLIDDIYKFMPRDYEVDEQIHKSLLSLWQ